MVIGRNTSQLLVLLVLISIWFVFQQSKHLGESQRPVTIIQGNEALLPLEMKHHSNTTSKASSRSRHYNFTLVNLDDVLRSKNRTFNDVLQTHHQDIPPKTLCRILITNWWPDHHYEVLESIALRFPLPWTKLKHNCTVSGLDPNNPIEVDFLLSFARHVSMGKVMTQMEGWGWKSYFEQYLQGRVRNRTSVDGRYIKFSAIVGSTMEEKDALDLRQYGAEIEASCDKPIALQISYNWMREDSLSHYCVMHENNPSMPKELAPQTCHLNPMHYPACWFLPIDYPTFPTIESPKNVTLSVCIPTRQEKDPSPLIHALQELQPSNLKVQLQGRRLQSKLKPFAAANLSHYLLIRDDLHDYWSFQQHISQCHVLVPLVEPSGESLMYFQGKGQQYMGKLSGFVAQMIGNRIPGLIHTELANIYRPYFTAPIFEYNNTNNFTEAFRHMLATLRST